MRCVVDHGGGGEGLSKTIDAQRRWPRSVGQTGAGGTATDPQLRLSVCIPCYSASPTMLQECIDSAAPQLPPGAELVVLPNGAHAIETVANITLPQGARVEPSEETLDLIANWNRSLDAATGALIHLLHEDDAVAPGFYAAVAKAARRYPDAALYATASQSFDAPLPAADVYDLEPEHLDGLAAARFLLVDDRHSCGNVVITRRVLDEVGGFRARFGYGGDEEAFLRFAAAGGIGFHPAPLFRNRVHVGQLRYSSWRRPEFVAGYVGARLEGARCFDGDAVALAERSTVERVVSAFVTLALAGYRDDAVAQLRRLEAFIQPTRSRRVTAAKLVCRSSVALALVRLRRRFRPAHAAGHAHHGQPAVPSLQRT